MVLRFYVPAMPLLKGKANIGRNIETEEGAGKPHDQALAIALRVAGVPKKAGVDDTAALQAGEPVAGPRFIGALRNAIRQSR
jgi:hypothetical protein